MILNLDETSLERLENAEINHKLQQYDVSSISLYWAV